jgi:hypothetical protein
MAALDNAAASPMKSNPTGPTNMPTGLTNMRPAEKEKKPGLPKPPSVKVDTTDVPPALRMSLIILGIMAVIMILFIVSYQFFAQANKPTVIINGQAQTGIQ